jgi:lipopolysaccharide biosynthesis glycosyltransferase
MEFAFCINDAYAQYVCVTICSIFENNPGKDVHIHILTDGLSEKNIQKMESLVKKYGGKVSIYNVDNKQFDGLKMTWSVYAWYRCVIPELLPDSVQKILYLDADTVVAGKIDELFEMDMTNIAVMAVSDTSVNDDSTYERLGYEKSKKYFCTGVLMMNLAYWREHHISEKVLDWGRKNFDINDIPDQDALNVICQDCKIHLPLKFGIMSDFILDIQFITSHKHEIRELLNDARIIHYAACPPWIYEKDIHFLSKKWHKYAKIIGGVKRQHYFTAWSDLAVHYLRRILNMLHLYNYQRRWYYGIRKQTKWKIERRFKKLGV